MTKSGAEAVEIVDSKGLVTAIATRQEMRDRVLRHRAASVVVLAKNRISSQLELVVHQRSPEKDVYPLYWDVAFGGVCDVGETWIEAAQRELAEEAGVNDVELLELGQDSYEDEQVSVVGRVFVAVHPGPFSFVDGEVIQVDRVPVVGINFDQWLNSHQVCDDSLAITVPLIKKYFSDQEGD